MVASTATASKVVYDSFGSASAGGLGGEFTTPRDIAVNRSGVGPADVGDVYVVDDANHRIQRFDADGSFEFAIGRDVIAAGKPGDLGDAFEKCTVAADCKAGSPGITTDGPTGEFDNPQGIAVDEDTGNIYVSDRDNRRIQEFDGDGAFIRMWGFDVIVTGQPNDAGSGFEVCDTTKGNVAANCKNGVAGAGVGQIGSTTQAGVQGVAVSQPDGNAATGTVFLADSQNRRVNTYKLDGTSPSSFGSATQFGTGVAANAAQPRKLAVDSRGVVYASDSNNSGEIDRYDFLNANGGGAAFLPSILAQNSLPTVGPLLPGNDSAGGTAATATSGLAVDPDSDGAGSDQDILYVLRDPSAGFGSTVVQQLGPVNKPGFSAAPVNADDKHGDNGNLTTVTGLGLNDSLGVLYASTAADGHLVHRIIDAPVLAPGATTGTVAAGPESYLATLTGRVNPNGFKVTDCHFEYGLTAAYGMTAPCTPNAAALGDGSGEVAVSAVVGPLESNTVYHYRLFAANVGQEGQGKDRTFTTGNALADGCDNAAVRSQQGIEVQLLPDCLALEQVSSPQKGNQPARIGSGVLPGSGALSPDSQRVLFSSIAALGGCPILNALGGGAAFVADRDPGLGWGINNCTEPPLSEELAGRFPPLSFSPDLSSWFQRIQTPSGQRFFQQDLSGAVVEFTPPLVNLGGPSRSQSFRGASADHTHLYLSQELSSEAGFPRDAFLLPGDPVPAGAGEDPNLYVSRLDEAGDPVLQLVAEDASGKVWGGNCGARLGGMETDPQNFNLRNGERNQGAISPDGSRVYFSTRPAQPEALAACTESNKKRIMVREEIPSGPVISELITSECVRAAPACSATDGDDVYQGASMDQSKIYFTTTRQLADTDLDGTATSCSNSTAVPGCDLYLYDASKPLGERLTQVSAGESTAASQGSGASVRNSITAISADGSRAYFVAQTVLTTDANPVGAVAQGGQPNLYVYTADDGDLAFIGTLSAGDGGGVFGGEGNWSNGAYAVPITGTNSQGEQFGGDGHVLLFNVSAALVPGDSDAAQDLYRYDATAGTLLQVSVASPGGTDDGQANSVVPREVSPGTDYADQGRWVSEDGRSVVFMTAEALLPGDGNGVEDSYLWREGQLFHLPGATRSSLKAKQILPVLSRDGRSVAYHTDTQLLASDGDTAEDVYVLRAGGGFLIPPDVPDCVEEECQGPPTPVSGTTGAITGSFAGAGNVRPASKCPKGKRKVRRNGRVRCVKPKKKAGSHRKTRAGSNQGGQK